MTKRLKTRRTPAEEARQRLSAQPSQVPLAVVVSAAPPESANLVRPVQVAKTTIEIMKELAESHEQSIIALKKRLDEAEGDLFRVVSVLCQMAYDNGSLMVPQKSREILNAIVIKCQGKTSR